MPKLKGIIFIKDKAISDNPELKRFLKILEMGYQSGKTSRHQEINTNIIREIEKLMNDKLY
jgi:hypothetical protein